MKIDTVERIVRAWNEKHVRYLIAGGLAVVAHGFVRFTADMDVVLDPSTDSLRRALSVLSDLGYRPRAPVPLDQFADPARRREWGESKGLTVFSLASSDHPGTEIDLFLEPPFDFDLAYANARTLELAPGVAATFVGLEDLLAMKRLAGRPQDLQDIESLRSLTQGPETE